MRLPALLSLLLAVAASGAAAGWPVEYPEPRSGDRWRACFDKQAQELKLAGYRRQTAPQVLFLGDSITESWRGTDNCLPCNPRGRSACDAVPAVFSRFWGADSAAAQGIGGDQVAHLIWRMQRGALPKKNPPRVVVLMIGTNDLGVIARGTPRGVESNLRDAAPGVARRVQQAVGLIQKQLPTAEVILMGLLPRGTGSGEGVLVGKGDFRWPSVFTQSLASVNSRLSSWARSQSGVHYLDCGPRFIAPGGRAINEELLPDALHPGGAGFAELARCLDPLIEALRS